MQVFLTGVSCVGKFAVGAALAELLGNSFFDLDHEIENQACTLFEGRRGPQPVAEHKEPEHLYGEIGRLKIELDWLKKKSEMRPS